MIVCEICIALAKNDGLNFYETKYWSMRLGYNQAYLGRALVMLKRHDGTVSNLKEEEWLELKTIMNQYESRLTELWGANSFNWTCLMNDAYKNYPANPHVHWHVWPRYEDEVIVDGQTFSDPNFGHHYDKNASSNIDGFKLEKITSLIRQ